VGGGRHGPGGGALACSSWLWYLGFQKEGIRKKKGCRRCPVGVGQHLVQVHGNQHVHHIGAQQPRVDPSLITQHKEKMESKAQGESTAMSKQPTHVDLAGSYSTCQLYCLLGLGKRGGALLQSTALEASKQGSKVGKAWGVPSPW